MRVRIITFTIFFILIPGLVFAQVRMLKGQVLFVGDNDESKPAAGVDVTLKETGDTAKTKSMGLFRIFLPDIFKTGEKVTLQVKKEGWRIQYPLDGEARISSNLIKETVEVRLLPVGSKKIWSDDRIKKFIEDVAQKAKEQVTPEGKPEDIDFSRYIKEWAIQYGFSAKQAKEEIDKWIAEVEKKDDYFELGLAAYAKKKFGEAGKLLSLAAKSKAKELKALKEKEASLTEETVRSYRLAGDAYYNDYRFEAALASYKQAVQYIDKEKSPWLWARVNNEIGKANLEIGTRTDGKSIHQHLSAAVSAYRLALEARTRESLPQDWAATQNNLGIALRNQGIRTGGGRRGYSSWPGSRRFSSGAGSLHP